MSTNNLPLYAELGRFPLSIGRHIRIIKYWSSLYQTKQENCILRTINLDQRQEVKYHQVSQIGQIRLNRPLAGYGLPPPTQGEFCRPYVS